MRPRESKDKSRGTVSMNIPIRSPAKWEKKKNHTSKTNERGRGSGGTEGVGASVGEE